MFTLLNYLLTTEILNIYFKYLKFFCCNLTNNYLSKANVYINIYYNDNFFVNELIFIH